MLVQNTFYLTQMTIAGGELANTGVVPHNWGTLYYRDLENN